MLCVSRPWGSQHFQTCRSCVMFPEVSPTQKWTKVISAQSSLMGNVCSDSTECQQLKLLEMFILALTETCQNTQSNTACCV